MAKVTSKLQLTIPKAVAEEYAIRPGDDLDLIPAGEGIRLVLRGRPKQTNEAEERLRLFDLATERQRRRQARLRRVRPPAHRGWTREDLYTRGVAR